MSSSRNQIAIVLLLLLTVPGCDQLRSRPGLNSRTESEVMERFMSSRPGEMESPWQELETTLGAGETISLQEFVKVTGYELSGTARVECRIWRNHRGEWLAIAYEPEGKSVSAIKSHMRR